jgi:hypothetical protein
MDIKGIKSEVFDFETHIRENIRQSFIFAVFSFIYNDLNRNFTEENAIRREQKIVRAIQWLLCV